MIKKINRVSKEEEETFCTASFILKQISIYEFLQKDSLKPALSPFKALICFIICSHYINLVILPFVFGFFTIQFNLYSIFGFKLFIFFDASLIETKFIVIMFFAASFFKTNAITGVTFKHTKFFLALSRQMIENKSKFLLFIIIYILATFLLVFFVFNYFLTLDYLPDRKFRYIADNLYLFINYFVYFDTYGNFYFLFPFSFFRVSISCATFFLLLYSILGYQFINFILRPVRFYIWDNFR